MRIVCFHLYNDYSGSPKVLHLVLENLLKREIQIDLVTSKGGILDELVKYQNLKYITYRYTFTFNHIITFLHFLRVQLYTFLFSFCYLFKRDITFYINTLLPIGPAFAGRIMRKRVVYHYHENAKSKGLFYRILCWWMEHLASDIICVSAYQRSFLKRKKNVFVVPNALDEDFVKRISPNIEQAFLRKKVLMLGSLKLYKGTLEFINLSKELPQFRFELIINDSQGNINNFLSEHSIKIPANLSIYARQNDVVPFYNNASLVLNLSNKDLVVETFGLTALEAMTAGLPVIVPTVGGIAEMVTDGVNGYKIDVQELQKIKDTIINILTDKSLYVSLANNALLFSKNYSAEEMCNSIVHILQH